MTASPANNFDLISSTAISAAYGRQFSDIAYAFELSQLVNAQTVFEQHAGNNLQGIAPLIIQLEARYKAINSLIATLGSTQIIELASGLLPRGMLLSEHPNITFVESDLSVMINLKHRLVRQLIGERPNLYFKAIDATSKPSQFPIHVDYLRKNETVTIVCEGLLMYLTFPEMEQVSANIRDMLRNYGGAWITSDIDTKEKWDRMQETNPETQKMLRTISDTTNRPIIDNSFNNLEQARQFFVAQGFCIKEYNIIEIMGELTCLKQLGVDSDEANRLLAKDFVVFMLTLDS